jgi:uncharacterized protein YdhG (YjbR/CyaY superfamily)
MIAIARAEDVRGHLNCAAVSAQAVDQYLRALEEPKRSTLQRLRRTILEIVPEAEQVISYGVPAFRVGGKTIAGFAAFNDHLSYLPFSGSVLGQLGDELEGYAMTKSSLHFPVDRPLPKTLVRKLIRVRLGQTCRGLLPCPRQESNLDLPLRRRKRPGFDMFQSVSVFGPCSPARRHGDWSRFGQIPLRLGCRSGWLPERALGSPSSKAWSAAGSGDPSCCMISGQ